MRIGLVGLGKMGANMSRRLIEKGHEVVGFDLGAEARQAVAGYGAETVDTLEALVDKLSAPRVVWVMVPAGAPTDETVERLSTLLDRGDVVIDGGNSNYKEAAPMEARLAERGLQFIDAGTSGGVWGLENGYCLMVGGTKEAVGIAEPILRALAPEGGYAHVGPAGAGHFVKMVHNGIEYGLMEAYAEGFEIMAAAEEFDLDLHEIASIWRYGSVVRSWLLELTERALSPGSG
ncbi:MAG TPA: decarboxylating 6-phosphogluconate dehydrogenase, partial [Acidimicrobiales bacterium]|nr:decarboxylating 6-phosphogluconate dehydrogenase [Acidimicrobiales bacterium]